MIDLTAMRELFRLKSYRVFQDPKTFLTVIFRIKRNRYGDEVRVVVGEWPLPGLASDPDVTIPAGMWKELVVVMKKKDRVGEDAPRRETTIPSPVRAFSDSNRIRAANVQVRQVFQTGMNAAVGLEEAAINLPLQWNPDPPQAIPEEPYEDEIREPYEEEEN